VPKTKPVKVVVTGDILSRKNSRGCGPRRIVLQLKGITTSRKEGIKGGRGVGGEEKVKITKKNVGVLSFTSVIWS